MARGDEKLNHLGQMWLFSTCSRKDLQRLARVTDEIEIPKGKTIMEEGAPGREVFLILGGSAVVRRKGRKIATVGPGQYVGELALLTRLPRDSTVVAETDMRALVLGQREFSAVLDDVPGLSHKLLEVMANRLRDADTKVSA